MQNRANERNSLYKLSSSVIASRSWTPSWTQKWEAITFRITFQTACGGSVLALNGRLGAVDHKLEVDRVVREEEILGLELWRELPANNLRVFGTKAE
jgi:hypothetical protein